MTRNENNCSRLQIVVLLESFYRKYKTGSCFKKVYDSLATASDEKNGYPLNLC